MKKISTTLFFGLMLIITSSCVSNKKYQSDLAAAEADCEQRLSELANANAELQAEKIDLEDQLRGTQDELLIKSTSLQNAESRNATLQEQVDYLKSTNTNLLDRMAQLSVISEKGAESIQKSLETLNNQNQYIQNLTSSIQAKDSLNLALVMNLKRSLSDVNDEDVTIEVKKGVVYISLSDKMLFTSGSYTIKPRAQEVLGKIAKIVNDRKSLDILVEGHTDNVPINTNCLKDNWDLSVMRATAVVRTLQNQYNVDPARMTAGGRSEFVPKAANSNPTGRAINRRTEIIILPKLDEFFQLLEPPTAENK